MKMIRSVLSSVVEGAIKRFSGAGRKDETITDREYFQHFGFTSIPVDGAEGIAVNEGGHIVMIATDDRRYRPALNAGEACIYNVCGDFVKIDRNRNITVMGGASVQVASPEVAISGVNGQTNLTISGNAALTGDLTITGNLDMTGNLAVNGDITCTGSYPGK